MTSTGAYDTVNSTPPNMDDPSAHVFEQISYWLSMSVVFILKDIMGLIIFVSGGSKERKNGALKVVYVAICSQFESIELYHLDMIEIMATSPI